MQKIQGGVTTTLLIYGEQDKKLAEIAKRFGIKKTQAHRHILQTGLDSYSAFEGMGIVKLAEITKKTREILEKSRQPSLI